MGNLRNSSLDGLRAVAVLLVFLYHHGLLNSGWLGVDVFFVLSGFLITSMLRNGRHEKHFWKTFWLKRVLRIMPPLVLVLLLTASLSFPLSLRRTGAYLLSLGDILAYLRPGDEPLRPLWSLAVEEHFYLLWPLLVRRCRRRALLVILLTVAATEPLLRGTASLYTHQWELTYFLTPFRMDGLAMGSLLALLMEDAELTTLLRRWSAPVGICLVGAWFSLRLLLGNAFTRDDPTATYNALSYSLTTAVSACALSYLLTHAESSACRTLRLKPLAWLGLISYGLYLYQVPIHEAANRLQPQLGKFVWMIDAPVTLIFAVLSYYVIEKPVMRLSRSARLSGSRDNNTHVASSVA